MNSKAKKTVAEQCLENSIWLRERIHAAGKPTHTVDADVKRFQELVDIERRDAKLREECGLIGRNDET